MTKAYHVIASNGRWGVRSTQASKATKLFSTQDSAVAYAIDLAKKAKTNLYVHKADGSVATRKSFSVVTPISR